MSCSVPEHFFSCDWGTTSFRLRLATVSDGEVIDEIATPHGVKEILNQLLDGNDAAERERAFSTFLREQLVRLRERSGFRERNAPVMISGMASSSVGWREVPYATMPFRLDGAGARVERVPMAESDGQELPVWLVSGLATNKDMMRGEETELIGLMSRRRIPGENGLVILPGTHSKHIQIRGHAAVDFRTFMTGELFAVLCEHSLLRVSVLGGPSEKDDRLPGVDEAAFRAGVETVRHDGLAGSLFKVRARSVLERLPATANRSFLSGLLIGAELIDSCRGKDFTPIVLAATGAMARSYQLAGEQLGLEGRVTVVEERLMKRAAVLGQAHLLRRLLAETPR